MVRRRGHYKLLVILFRYYFDTNSRWLGILSANRTPADNPGRGPGEGHQRGHLGGGGRWNEHRDDHHHCFPTPGIQPCSKALVRRGRSNVAPTRSDLLTVDKGSVSKLPATTRRHRAVSSVLPARDRTGQIHLLEPPRIDPDKRATQHVRVDYG